MGGICSGAGITLNNFSARKNNAGDWEVTDLPGVAMAPSDDTSTEQPGEVDIVLLLNSLRPKVVQAARNAPSASGAGVTQSSNASNGVTVDSVNAEVSDAAGQQRFVGYYNGMEIVDTAKGTDVSDDDSGFLGSPKGTQYYVRDELGGQGEAASLSNVSFYRNLTQAEAAEFGLEPGEILIDTYSDHEGGNDTDYLAGGFWLYLPDDAHSSNDYEYGAYISGNDPFQQNNLAGVAGTVQYSGSSTGYFYSPVEEDALFLDADVTLTAEFGNGSELGTISGRIHNFEIDDLTVTGNPEVTLGSADIGSSNSGFFTGDTSMTFDGSDFSGKWGGQFYGNGADPTDAPGSVAGTFGGASADGTEGFVGIFGAYKP